MPRFHRAVRYCSLRESAALFAYIGASTEQCGLVRLYWRFNRQKSGEINTQICWYSAVGLPSRLKGLRKRGATHAVILKSLKKYPVWYDQVTDIFATQTARKIVLDL